LERLDRTREGPAEVRGSGEVRKLIKARDYRDLPGPLGGRGLLRDRPDRQALPSDRDASASGEVEVVRDLTAGGDVLGDAEADDLGHTSLIPVPVDLEALGVALVEVVLGDEVEAVAVRVGAGPLDHDDREAGLRVSGESLGGGDLEGVLRASGGHDVDSLVVGPVEGLIPSCRYIIPRRA